MRWQPQVTIVGISGKEHRPTAKKWFHVVNMRWHEFNDS